MLFYRHKGSILVGLLGGVGLGADVVPHLDLQRAQLVLHGRLEVAKVIELQR